MQQSGLPKRLVDRESEQNEREEADVRKLSDIMAVMGLAVVFVGIAMFIACWRYAAGRLFPVTAA